MALNLNNLYYGMLEHAGHEIVCVTYGGHFPTSVSIECETCSTVLLDAEEHNQRNWKSNVSYEEIQYMRDQLDQLIFSKDLCLTRIAEMAGISKTSLYDMYDIRRQHTRNRRTMFNKLYKTFWQIKPFNPNQETA